RHPAPGDLVGPARHANRAQPGATCGVAPRARSHAAIRTSELALRSATTVARMTQEDVPAEPRGVKRGGDRVRSLARPVLDVLDRRFDQLHRHLDGVADRIEHSDDIAELRQLFPDTLT